MNNFKTLFLNEFSEIINNTKKTDITSAFSLIQIIKSLHDKQQIILSAEITKNLNKRLFKPKTQIQINKNWDFIQKVFEFGHFKLDNPTIDSIKKGNDAVLSSFAYQMFNFIDILKYSKRKTETGNNSFESTNFEKLQSIKSINDCDQLFEKMIFILSKAMNSTTLNVF